VTRWTRVAADALSVSTIGFLALEAWFLANGIRSGA